MSTPITADQLLAQLKKWKVPYREIDGWRTRGRDAHTGLPFGPVFGCVTHHTGDDAPDTADRNVIINGRPDLPGPLAQFGLNDDGVVDLISVHRCNHAGGGDPRVLEAVKAESYGDYPPAPHEHQGSRGAVDGNDCFYGVETYYSGKAAPTAKAYRSLVLLWAAICDFHGWTAKSVIGHKEWSDWKVDPGHVDMKVLRADVQKVLDAAHAPAPTIFRVHHRVVSANLFVKSTRQVENVNRIIANTKAAFRYAPDAIAAQEAGGRLDRVEGYQLFQAGEGEAARELGVLLRDGLQCLGVEFHPVVDGTGSGALDHPRGVLVVKYLKRGHRVAVTVGHAPVFGEVRVVAGETPGEAAAQHAEYAQAVARIEARLRRNGFLTFVCADANSRGHWDQSLPVVLAKAGLQVTRDGVDVVTTDPVRVGKPDVQLVSLGKDGTPEAAHDAVVIRVIEKRSKA